MNKDRQGSHIKPALLESLEPRLLLSGSAVISEFMASNSITILDGLGQSSDWIELHNPTPSPVSLNGWFLTDDSDDLDKWMIPNVTLAAAGDPGGDDYLIIFASGQDDADYPYWDGQYHHTNFKLSSNDSDQHESVLLVKDDALTVEHGYEDYPEQVADVSYGMGDSAPIYHELVAVGDTSSYLVPTAGHAALLPDTEPGGDPGWTADTFDDSTWTNTTLRDQAGMIITEIDSGTPNFVEIQNVSDAAIDTAGWSVLVNDASVSISSVNALEWDLPSSVSPSEVLYRSDDPGDASHYWGGAIDWVIGQDGWAMIVDDTGDVVDFVVWGYSSAEINDPLNFAFSYEVSPGVFVDIDAYGEWSGDGAIVGDGTGGTPGAQQDVVEFGDSWYYMHPLDGVDPAIADTDFNSTWTLPVGYDGPAFTGPNAAMLGFGTINSGGGVDSNIGTPPSGSRRTAYFRRELVLSDELVSAGIEILSDDGAIIYIDGVEVARNNISASDTYMAMASGSSYADNGSPTENETRTLAISDVAAGAHWISVSVHQNSTGSSDMGFDMRLFGQLVPDPGQVLKRSDNGDDDVAEDFLSTDTASMGLQNSALTVPFGITAPARTGLGFSADQPEFDSLILTDVGSEMQGVNASLWTRIDFNVASTSLYDTLTLRMKYNDGFVAYLNGSVVAWRNAPGTLAWDSSAASTRSDANSVVFEDIDITEHLFGALRNGPNVLAIHALNTSPADSNLLIVPELVATSDSDTQYMSSPSPDGANSPGALGLVADTEFSVDRGFYESPQVLAITSDTLGASIRYTLDGTKPTESHGTLYTTPIDITTTTTLRAIAYFPGYISSNVDTQTYIFPYAVVEQTGDGFPDDWGVVAGYSDYEIDPEVVGTNAAPNPTYYDDFIEGLTAIPTLSVVLPVSDIFANGGLYDNPGSTSMEREASAELIYPDGSRGFQIDAGLKMQGGASRSTGNSPKHSMSLRFRQQYGPGHLDFPLYDGSPVDSFNSLQLRAVYNNSWIHWSSGQRNVGSLIRDQWARDALLAMGQEDAGQGVYVHLYIDGLYWGVHMLQERQEASHYAAYHGGDEDTIDALNSGAAIDGTTASWLAMHNLVAVSATDGIDLAEFQAIQQKLDVVSFIDYMMVNQYAFNADWDGHNWRAAGGGTNDAPWRVYSWDAERILETGQLASNRLSLYNSNKPSGLFQDLRQSPEFNLMFADRIHKHFYNDGVFTPDRAAGLWMDLADQLDQAIVAESARWGDYRRDVHVRGSADLYTRDGHWYPQQQALMDSYFYQTNPSKRRRDQEVLEDYVNASLYPAVDAPVFYIEGSYRHGGAITSGDLLTIVDPSYQGIIYYTLDGTDPRLPGGSVNTTSAITYGGGTLLNSSAKVMSRVLKDGVWSALNEATYDVSVAPTIAITEINYNPYDPTVSEDLAGYEDAEDFEFVEIRNIGAQTVDLRTVHFSDGIEFDFTRSNVTSLAAGDYAVVVRSTSAFQERYGVGISIAGEFGGFLSSGGEGVELAHGGSSVFLDFNFNDTNDWPGRADGKGASLEIVDPLGDYSDPLNWRSSVVYGGTPGRGPELPVGVVINEVLTHTDLPLVDSIELHNTTAAPVDIGGWFLSDTWGSSMNPGNGDYKKYTIAPGTSIPTGGYLVLDEDDFNSSGGVDPLDFALSGAHGDDVWLMVADGLGDITYFADHVSFPATDNGESLGRWPDGSGALYPMLSRTLGSDNSTGANGPRVGPVIISEVMYHPPYAAGDVVFQTTFDTDSDGFAYIDDAFNGTSNPAYASGVYDPTGGEIGGGLSMYLGPGDTGGPTSGAASRSVTLSTDESLDVSFRYRLMTSDGFEFNEYGDVILEVDGVRYGGDAGGSVVRVIGPAKDTGWDTARFTTSGLLAGPHTVSIGVYNNRASGTDEFVELFIDDVEIYVGTGSPLPDDLEFIELYNPTAVDIPLAAWTENPHAPGQYFADWRLRGGVDMEFDPGTTIGAQSMLVILSFDPNKPENASRVAGFRSYYGIDTSVPLAGGYEGKLSNNSERITLQRPDSPPAEETSFVPHVLEDQVIYDDLAPWATSADGLGDSLQRTPINGWGDDPANWIAGTPDPGAYASINNSPVVDNPIVDVTVDEDAVDTVVDLSATFSDPDLNTFTLSVTGNTDAGLVAASMNVDQLTLSYLADQNGSTDITIRATDTLGAWTEDTFTVTVNPTPDPPTLNNPVADFSVDEDASDTVIDLSSVFDDPDLPGDTLVYSITSNTNISLVTTNIVDSDLTLSYAADQNGSSEITVRATDQNGAGSWVEDTFTVTVDPVNDAPTLASPLAEVTVDEDAPDTVIDLSSVFDDIDLGDALTFQVTVNTNISLVATDVTGSDLTLSYLADQSGSADITVRATDSGAPGLFVEDTFSVTVDPVNDAPTVIAPISDVNAFENDPGEILNLAGVFYDAEDSANVTLSLEGNTNPALVTANLVGSDLTVSYAADQSGSSDITIRATDTAAPGLWVEETFTVTVNPDNFAPTVVSQIADLTVNTGDPDTVMYLSDVFDDSVGLKPTLDYTVIEIDPVTGAQSAGTGLFLYTFTLYGNDGVESVFATTTLTFTGAIQQTKAFGTADVNDELNAAIFEGIAGSGYLAGLDTWIFASWQEIAPNDTSLTGSPVVLSVGSGTAEYFEQKDVVQIVAAGDVQWTGMHARLGADYPTSGTADANRLAYSISDNTNPSLVTASVVGAQLTLDYSPGGSGVADITIRATDPDGAWAEDTFTVTVESSGEIVGRHVFYNNSAWDGVSDDDAIASDKTALLAGQTAGFANYTSYSRGINGIMVDIDGMTGTPDASDFIIKVNASDDPDTWSAGPTPTVTVRPGEGVGGSDRVTLVWPDGAIANQWVEVTVLATADTGLAAADVFYFGNAVGETSGDGVIGQAEYDTFKSQFGQRGGIGALASDFDGDGRVGLRDFALMRSRFGDEVQSPTVPAPAPPAAAAPAPALAPEADLLAESSTTSEAAALDPLSVAVGEVDLSTPTASPAPEPSVELELTDVLLGEDSGEGTDASLDTDSLLVDVLAESTMI